MPRKKVITEEVSDKKVLTEISDEGPFLAVTDPVTAEIRTEDVSGGAQHATAQRADVLPAETEEAAEQTRQLLALEEPPTCIIYPDDTSLIGGRNVIIEMGLKIPRDVSVAGYDGTRVSQLLHPKFTTIRQDAEQIGSEAANRLVGTIENPKTALVERVIIDGTLLPGRSVKRIGADKEEKRGL